MRNDHLGDFYNCCKRDRRDYHDSLPSGLTPVMNRSESTSSGARAGGLATSDRRDPEGGDGVPGGSPSTPQRTCPFDRGSSQPGRCWQLLGNSLWTAGLHAWHDWRRV